MKKADEILKALLSKEQFKAMDKYGSVFRGWEQVVGEGIAAHARIIELEKNCVVLEVDHPAWKQEVLMKERKILKKLQNMYPELDLKSLKIHLIKNS